MDCNKPIKTVSIADLPIDTLANLPDYILAERDVEDPSDGSIDYTFVRVPAQKLFPQGNYANIAAIETNNTAITVPDNEVRAGYVANEGSANVVKYADENHAPIFLMLGFSTDLLLVQSTGIVNILEGHSYIVGQDYWASTDGSGEPVTNSESGQHLFKPISNTQLAVNIYTE